MELEMNLKRIEDKLRLVEEAKVKQLIQKKEQLRGHSEKVSSRFQEMKELSGKVD